MIDRRRRQLLRVVGVSGLTAFAGCGSLPGADIGSSSGRDGSDPGEATTPVEDERSVDELRTELTAVVGDFWRAFAPAVEQFEQFGSVLSGSSRDLVSQLVNRLEPAGEHLPNAATLTETIKQTVETASPSPDPATEEAVTQFQTARNGSRLWPMPWS